MVCDLFKTCLTKFLGYGSPEWVDKDGNVTKNKGERYFMPCIPFPSESPLLGLLTRMTKLTSSIAQNNPALKKLDIDYTRM